MHKARLSGALFVLLLIIASDKTLAAQGMRSSLHLVPRNDQATYAPGEIINVTVTPPVGTIYSEVRVIGESPIGISQVKVSPPFDFSLSIPSNTLPGRYRLTAIGSRSPSEVQDSVSITIDVERSDPPSMITVEPSLIRFQYAGSQMPLGVTGLFHDGEHSSVTKSSRTIYKSSNNKVATVDALGVVTATGPGEASINVRYGGESSIVTVIVPGTIRGDLDGDGDVDQDDLNIITDASGRSATGPFDARDLNGDGLINNSDRDILESLCTRQNCIVAGPAKDGERSFPIRESLKSESILNEVSSSVTLVDPVPVLLKGAQVTTDTNLLATQGTIIQGVSADGVAEIILRIPASRVGEQFDLTVMKDTVNASDSINENGALAVPGTPTFLTNITVGGVSTNSGIMGFAIYRAPLDFPRQNGFDSHSGTRTIFVEVKSRDTGGLSTSVPLTVVRPPVILIHGLWSDPYSFGSFTPFILDSNYFVKLVDYSQPVSVISSAPAYSPDVLMMAKGNALGFSYNSPKVLDQTKVILSEFKNTKVVAAIQADIVAHSLGGNIARALPLLAGFLSSDTFGQGTIHKLISIGTPHLGTPLATLLLQDNNKCTRDLLASNGLISFGTATLAVGSTFNGAVLDLQGDITGANLSSALKSIQQSGQSVPMALIGGSMSQAQLDGLHCTQCAAAVIFQQCNGDILGGSLTPQGWPTIVGNASDAVVPLNSQLDGKTASSSLVSVHAAVHSAAVADKSGFGSIGFGSPHELEEASGIPNKVYDFLNTPLTGGSQNTSSATWILPSSARAAGLGGSFYTTDLTISNTSTIDATVSLKFLGNNTDGRSGPEKNFLLGAKKTVTYQDVLGSVFGLSSGFGAIRIISSTPNLIILGQTSTPGAGGTFGQSVPATDMTDMISTGFPRSIIGIREDASFRTNLILSNATDSPIDVDVQVDSDSTNAIGAKRYNIPPLGMTQVTKVVHDVGVSTNLSVGRLQLSTPTTGGIFAAYASVIDNVTNDPRTLLPRSATLGSPMWILPSTARAAGAGGAFYTTDLSISNIGTAEASFTLKFLGNNVDGRQGSEKNFLLGAKKTVTYQDVLGSVFGLSSGFGPIRITSSTPNLIILGQTSTPGAGGTFGQSVPATDMTDMISTGFPRSIVGIREDASFRTNLILANATEVGLDVDVSLIGEDGGVLASRRYTLLPLGMTQVSRVVRDLGVNDDLKGVRLLLSTPTNSGSFAAYASIIDNVTNDPRTLLPLRGYPSNSNTLHP